MPANSSRDWCRRLLLRSAAPRPGFVSASRLCKYADMRRRTSPPFVEGGLDRNSISSGRLTDIVSTDWSCKDKKHDFKLNGNWTPPTSALNLHLDAEQNHLRTKAFVMNMTNEDLRKLRVLLWTVPPLRTT